MSQTTIVSQETAAEIMGSNFHSIDVAEKHFGPFTPEERAVREVIPFTEEMLQACRGEFILLPAHPLALPAIHEKRPGCFHNSAPLWFGEERQVAKWAGETIQAPWLLVRRNVLPGSWNKTIQDQKQHVNGFPGERLILPAEFTYAAVLRHIEAGERICAGYLVRFPVQTADGYWVSVCWYGERLSVVNVGGNASEYVASCSLRTS